MRVLLLALDRAILPRLETPAAVLGEIEVRAVPIPGDCVDGFLGAFSRRPEANLHAARA